MAAEPDPGSYRDPSGFVFRRDGALLRQVNRSFADEWHAFQSSGLQESLIDQGVLIDHEDMGPEHAATPDALTVIRPRSLTFISYPYEWCFSQLADAALLTLQAQEVAVAHGMTMRDANAYNVQFDGSRPILIDTLSFERLADDASWKPYRQFCEQFLAPLALMAYRDPQLTGLLRAHPDGIPLQLASKLLPWRSRLNLGLLAHLHVHGGSQRRHEDKSRGAKRRSVGKTGLLALMDGLRRTVKSLHLGRSTSTWGSYTPLSTYSTTAAKSKEEALRTLLARFGGTRVWDVGANDGFYSAVAAEGGSWVLALDSDPIAVERHYARLRTGASTPMLPLLADVMNPTPALGWNGEERASLLERANADVVVALALIHHLAIGHNVPLERISKFFRRLGPHLILEFVPKGDPMVQRLLATREDIFPHYTLEGVREAFSADYSIDAEMPIEDSTRVLLAMTRR